MARKIFFVSISLFALLLTSFQTPLPKTVLKPTEYPKNYFQLPIEGALSMSGNFGELRGNHFHAGMDIRPTKPDGHQPIFAAADGYIGRIKTQGGGYGQALYIIHDNGYTTVYGHLDNFSADILRLVREKQYASELFEQDIRLDSTQFRIKKGQQIGTMGNRGNSFGEHLHFEIRETATEKAINPLLFGFQAPDHSPPVIGLLKTYYLNEKNETVASNVYYPKKKNGNYLIENDTISAAYDKIAFAIEVNDAADGKYGKNGVYKITLKKDSQTVFRFTAETCGFAESRYLNAHTDYAYYKTRHPHLHRLFLLPGNFLTMYDSVLNYGITEVGKMPIKINIIVEDIAGNTSGLNFWVKRNNESVTKKAEPYNYFLPYNDTNIIKPEGAIFRFPAGCLYENLYLKFGTTTRESGTFSSVYHLHNIQTPLHRNIEIALFPQNLPDSLKQKSFVSYCERDDTRTYNCGGLWRNDGFLTAQNEVFGNYCIMIDTVAPTISPISFSSDVKNISRISFRIKDNFESMGDGTALKYRATVDNQFLLMEYDAKTATLFHNLNENKITVGEHIFKLEVTDFSCNEAVFERKIRR